MTYVGLSLVFLAAFGAWSSCRVAARADDVMSAWQRKQLMRERPRHLRR